MKVLIVDDSALVRERLKDMLSETAEVESIAQAKDLLEAIVSFHELNPEVVILDIRMPGGSGIDMLQRLKKVSNPPVVIIFTNYPYPQYRRKCIDVGADFFFDKSSEFEKIPQVLKQLKQQRFSRKGSP